MSKTADLRKLVMEKLQTVQGDTYHRNAPPDAAYPYKVYSLSGITFPDSTRDDYDLNVDIWDRGSSWQTVEEIADQLEALLNDANLPQARIYPTFFRSGRYVLDDPDKTLMHIQLRFLVQLCEEV